MNEKSSNPIRSGFMLGVREAFGVPAAVMTAGFIGYGSLSSDAGIPFWISVLATVSMWALPGQLVLVEMIALKAAVIATVIAVMMSAARFLPMTITLMPLLRDERNGAGASRLKNYFAAHIIAMTSWALAMRQFPDLQPQQRVPWLFGFGAVGFVVGIACCALGYVLAGVLPLEARIGLVFLTPVYFVILLFGDIRSRVVAVSLFGGAIAGPLVHLLAPEWSVLLGGLIGGTVAYVVQRRMRAGKS